MPRFASEILVPKPPGRNLRFSVIVPARNEAELLPGALHALAEQKELDGSPLSHDCYEVILLINNTIDASAEAARRLLRMYPTFQLHIVERWFKDSRAHSGRARRLLMDDGCRRLELAGNDGALILSTDSDTRVAHNWIAANCREIELGAEAVGGRILINGSELEMLDEHTRRVHAYDNTYRRLVSWLGSRLDPEAHDPWPRHHCHFGASLAILPGVYRRAGRLPPRRHLEDIAFYQELTARDVKLRHSNLVRVYTSGRLVGRTDFGFSRMLNDFHRNSKRSARQPVESKRFLEFLFSTRQQLRTLWLDRESEMLPHAFCRATGITHSKLRNELRDARCFGSLLKELRFYEVCRSAWPDWKRLDSLTSAVADLYADFRRTIRLQRTATPCLSTSQPAGIRLPPQSDPVRRW